MAKIAELQEQICPSRDAPAYFIAGCGYPLSNNYLRGFVLAFRSVPGSGLFVGILAFVVPYAFVSSSEERFRRAYRRELGKVYRGE